MFTFRRFVFVCSGAFALASAASATEFAIVPVSASGVHGFVGNEIVLQGGGQRVILELQISGWDPGMTGSPLLRAFQGVIDSAGYSSGLRGTLVPAMEPCATGTDCALAFGGACSFAGNVCNQASECQFFGPPLNEKCEGPKCAFPINVGGFCNPGDIFTKRADYVFNGVPGGDLPALDLTSNDFRFASATQSTSVADPGTVRYAGTLVLDVPVGATGTFTIPLKPLPDTLLQDEFSQFILPLTLTPAVITVACATAADCDDGSACTNDACTSGVCSNTPNFNTATRCCDPATGLLMTINDGNICTDDVCNAATGIVAHNPVVDGTACDNGVFCDGMDMCVGGICQAGPPVDCNDNVGCTDDSCDEAFNTCRNTPNNGLCDDAVFCNGNEVCNPTLDCQPGTPPSCSDGVGCTIDSCDVAADACVNVPDDTACNDALFCNGVETCSATQDCLSGSDPCPGQVCDEGPNTCVDCLTDADCDDGVFCDGVETCVGNNCQAGTLVDCNDGIACTDDACNETTDRCDHIPNDAFCLDDGLFCNGIEFCNAAVGCDHRSPPCAGPCDEILDLCSCIAPVLLRTGSRYIRVIPQSATGAPMRLVVTPVCPTGGVSRCVSPPTAVDLDVDGAVDETVASLRNLGGNCPFLTPAEWGELYIADATMAPDSEYMVEADCGTPGSPALSDAAVERTERFGDTVGLFDSAALMWTPPNGRVNIFDVLAILDRFSNKLGAPPIYWTDVFGIDANGFSCGPDHIVKVIPDVIVVLDAFQGQTYALSTGCPLPCP